MYTFWLNLCFWGLKKNVKYAPCITNNFCGFFSLLPEKFYWVAGGSAGTVVQCTMYIPSCVHSDLYLAWVMSCWGASWSTFWSLNLAWVMSSWGVSWYIPSCVHSDLYLAWVMSSWGVSWSILITQLCSFWSLPDMGDELLGGQLVHILIPIPGMGEE